MTHEKNDHYCWRKARASLRFIVAVSEQHLADVRFGPDYGLKAAVAAGPKSVDRRARRLIPSCFGVLRLRRWSSTIERQNQSHGGPSTVNDPKGKAFGGSM